MSKFLKGNYEIQSNKVEESKKEGQDYSEIFENMALEELGGSIAFVMKANKFVWDEDEDEDSK